MTGHAAPAGNKPEECLLSVLSRLKSGFCLRYRSDILTMTLTLNVGSICAVEESSVRRGGGNWPRYA